MEISKLIKQLKKPYQVNIFDQIREVPQRKIPVEVTQVMNQNRRYVFPKKHKSTVIDSLEQGKHETLKELESLEQTIKISNKE